MHALTVLTPIFLVNLDLLVARLIIWSVEASFLWVGCSSSPQTNSIKVYKAVKDYWA